MNLVDPLGQMSAMVAFVLSGCYSQACTEAPPLGRRGGGGKPKGLQVPIKLRVYTLSPFDTSNANSAFINQLPNLPLDLRPDRNLIRDADLSGDPSALIYVGEHYPRNVALPAPASTGGR